jgi:hypothetical protein
MSGGEDNVFTRWSRRKLSVRSTEVQATDDEKPPPDLIVETTDAARQAAAPEPEPAQAETDEPDEPLPRIEDLTAESDLSAFLRKGVPKALRSAAMRRMWSLDPGIRDYVGPSEYAWDFNQPGSMAGFGPMDTKETVVGFLSKTARAFEADAEETAANHEPSPADPLPEKADGGSPDNTDDTDTSAALSAETHASGSSAEGQSAAEGEAAQPPRQADNLSRPRHGGAMPR